VGTVQVRLFGPRRLDRTLVGVQVYQNAEILLGAIMFEAN